MHILETVFAMWADIMKLIGKQECHFSIYLGCTHDTLFHPGVQIFHEFITN